MIYHSGCPIPASGGNASSVRRYCALSKRCACSGPARNTILAKRTHPAILVKRTQRVRQETAHFGQTKPTSETDGGHFGQTKPTHRTPGHGAETSWYERAEFPSLRALNWTDNA